MSVAYNPLSGNFEIKEPGPAGTVSAAGDGSQATPSISFASDSDSGLYKYAANSIGVSTGGTNRLLIDSSGNVGIGVTTPGNADEGAGLQVRKYIDRNATYYTPDGHYAGSFGYTNNTQDKVWLSVDSEYAKSSAVSAGLFLSAFHADAGGSGCGSTIKNLKTGNALTFSTVATASGTGSPAVETERLRIDGSGNVGIGTSSPGTKLEISSGTDDDHLTLYKTGVAGGAGAGIKFSNQNNVGTSSFLAGIRNELTSGTPGAEGGALVFTTKNSGDASPQERLYISAAGNVGIGTSSPAQLLHLNSSSANATQWIAAGAGYTSNLSLLANGSGGGLSLLSATDSSASVTNTLNSALTFGTNNTERLRIDGSGRLLVGTSSGSGNAKLIVQGNLASATYEGILSLRRGGQPPSGGNHGIGDILFGDNSGNIGAMIRGVSDNTWGTDDYPARLVFSTTASGASSPTERMRITSGGTIIAGGTGSVDTGVVLSLQATSSEDAAEIKVRTNGQNGIQFRNASNVDVGKITINVSSTVYATTSDYRLKENIVPLTGASERVNQLQVHRFNFIADPDKIVDGFIAHEAQAVVPECVTGTKDGVDDDGNPVYQGIDQSKLVPLLTAALQEAITKIETLEQRLTDAGIA